jgi:hypothetical protein
MTPIYTVGDKVIWTSPDYPNSFTEGKEYVIKGIIEDTPGIIFYRLENDQGYTSYGGWFPIRFKRAKGTKCKTAHKFKVGDIVVGNSTHFLQKRRGMKGEIVQADFSTCYVIWDKETLRNLVGNREIDLLITENAKETPWQEMTPEQQVEILLASHRGENIELFLFASKEWCELSSKPELHADYCYRVKPKETVKEVNTIWGEMTTEQKGALLLAHQQGKPIEIKSSSLNWVKLEYNPMWLYHSSYRVRVEPVVVNSCKHISIERSICKLTYNKVDGVIDYSSAKLAKDK